MKNTCPASLLLFMSVCSVTRVFGQENASNPLAAVDNTDQLQRTVDGLAQVGA